MSDTVTNPATLLAPHRGDWMRKALGIVHLDGKQMAEFLGVDDATVSRWLNGRRKPGKQTLRLWAMRTGVPLSYLETGIIPDGWEGPNGTPSEDSEKITVWYLASAANNVTHANFGHRQEQAA